jgi:uncharacterized protein (TIGR03437 family)
MFTRLFLTTLLLLSPRAFLRAQGAPTGNVGWYNGDWTTGIPGWANYYVSDQDFARTYDNFVVPTGGWTITSVFSNNALASTSMTIPTEAVWEIRSGVSAGNGGSLVAFGRGAIVPYVGTRYADGETLFRVQVDGLRVQLAPGTYWLAVTPVMGDLGSYICVTTGTNAIGKPAGNDGNGYYTTISAGGNVTFKLVTGTGQNGTSGDYSLGVLISGPSTSAPSLMAVVNAASFQFGQIAPGEVVTLAGSGIGPATAASLALDANGNVATSLSGVQITFNGTPAPLIYVSSSQINAVVPYQVAGANAVTAQVTYNGQTSNALQLAPGPAAPGIFTYTGSGFGQAAMLNQDNSYCTAGNPAAKGSWVVMYLTGEGQTNPGGVTGKVTGISSSGPLTPQPALPVAVTIGGQPANIMFYGEAPGIVSGVMQLNVQIPMTAPSGAVPLSVTVGGKPTQAGVTVAVQ